MKIDEAIKFCHEKSENIKLKAEPQVFIDIAEWLELLKWYQQGMEDIPSESGVLPKDVYRAGYNKAIDEVIMQLDAEVESSAKFIREYDDSIAQKAYYSGLCHAKKIAEQLKAGGIDGNERTDT